jgi:ankyrin repeat protein
MVDFLSQYSRHVWTLSFGGYVDRLREILRDDPSLARVTSANGVTPLWWLPDDEDQALEIVELLLAHGANPAARSKEGTTAADWAAKRGMTRVVTRLSRGLSPFYG